MHKNPSYMGDFIYLPRIDFYIVQTNYYYYYLGRQPSKEDGDIRRILVEILDPLFWI